MKSIPLIVLLGFALTLAACAAGTPDAAKAASGGLVSELVVGFWHGIIAPITLLIEVIRALLPGVVPVDWRMLETAHPSVAYDVGFYFGITSGPTVFWARRRYR